MVRRLTRDVVLLALVGAVILLAVSGLAAGSGSGTGIDAPPQTTPDGFNNTVFRIQVHENGSAKWTVQHSTSLTTDSEITQFQSYAETFERTETDLYRTFRARAVQLTAASTNATGREMEASAFGREAWIDRLGQTRGVVELSFWWSNFSRSEAGRLVVDDIFAGGMYIDSGQRLVFTHGPNLTFSRVEPAPDSLENPDNLTASQSVTWFGQQQFADGRPLVEYQIHQLSGETTAEARNGAGLFPVILLVVVAVGVGGAVVWYAHRQWADSGGTQTELERPDDSPPPEPGEASRKDTAGPEPEFLTDEDRVLSLLEEHEGRMKQVKIVEQTDWSKSKVSMLLSEMEDEGTISKLRVGRENIISLAGEEPDAFGSPFDDE